jgi:hypothetical protein
MFKVSFTIEASQGGTPSGFRTIAARRYYETTMAELKFVACPQCGAKVAWASTSRWRPFCTERCKLIDLGAWASEKYRMAVEPPDEDSTPDDHAAPPRDD